MAGSLDTFRDSLLDRFQQPHHDFRLATALRDELSEEGSLFVSVACKCSQIGLGQGF